MLARPHPAVFLLAGLIVLLAPLPLWAHDGVHTATDFMAGVLHPLSGLDHLLVMLAVGVWAWTLGGKARWQLPLGFVCVMALGAVLGAKRIAWPGAEYAIALSVVLLGVLLARSKAVNRHVGLVFTALFALFHGAAHGAEMPLDASGLAYAAGFIGITAVLHAVGLAAAMALSRFQPARHRAYIRATGQAMALIGVVVLIGRFGP